MPLVCQDNFHGIVQLWPPLDSSIKTRFDLVLVPGLAGGSLSTWTNTDGSCWLDWFVREVSGIRLFAFGYNASEVYLKDEEEQGHSDGRTFTFAEDLCNALRDVPGRVDDPKPLTLLGHGVGGIIIKNALVLSHARQEVYGDIFLDTHHVIFLDTPHHGLDTKLWQAVYGKLASAQAEAQFDLWTKGLADLGKFFGGISQQFAITSVYASLPIQSDAGPVTVVEESSSVLYFPNEVCVRLVYTTHVTMCKFASPADSNYRKLRDRIAAEMRRLDLRGRTKSPADRSKRTEAPLMDSGDPMILDTDELAAEASTVRFDAANVMDAAIDVFLESLPRGTRIDSIAMDFQSSIQSLAMQSGQSKNMQRLRVACQSVTKFELCFKPFFHILEFVTESSERYSDFFWSALVFLLQRSVRYVTIFEKISEMLAVIPEKLPKYLAHFNKIERRCPENLKQPLVQTLAYVYADIVQFFQDICRLFTNEYGYGRRKLVNKYNRFWKPFDVRFMELCRCLLDHKCVFDIELKLEDYDKLMAFIGNIQRQKARSMNIQDRRCLGKEEELRMKTRIKHINDWISPTEYLFEFDNARRERAIDTCTWILEEPKYVSWKRANRIVALQHDLDMSSRPDKGIGKRSAEEQEREAVPKMLWLEAKAGFGKTTFSAAIIEDLRLEPDAPLDMEDFDEPESTVGFFHFDSQRPEKTHTTDALRAVIMQIIHAHSTSQELIDIISLLMDMAGSGPSSQQIEDIFVLFTARLPFLSIVLDAIDECKERSDLLPLIIESSLEFNFKCLYLSRPKITIPAKYRHAVVTNNLDGRNQNDIRNYFSQEAANLLDSGALEVNLSSDEIGNILAPRAQSMFLWARLMMSYLRSPALSLAEKEEGINFTNSLEGLDCMFGKILRQIGRTIKKEKKVLKKIFRLLTVCKRPPSVEELRMAVAIVPGQSLVPGNYICNFRDTLRKLGGDLLEIRPDDTVRLMHLALREFLLSDEAVKQKVPYYVDFHPTSARTAAIFLSYLVSDVPSRPLSGSVHERAYRQDLDRQLPLLGLAAQFWVDHSADSVRGLTQSVAEVSSIFKPLVPELSAFLSKKSSISVWIEACWTYKFMPYLAELSQELSQGEFLTDPALFTNFVSSQALASFRRLDKLSKDLTILRSEWEDVLRRQPNEIWGPSVSAFMGAVSWESNADAKVVEIGRNDNNNGGDQNERHKSSILVASKISTDGTMIALLEVFHSEPNNNASQRFDDCRASFKVMDITSEFSVVVEFDVDLDSTDLQNASKVSNSNTFRFPVVISDDLMQFTVLCTIYRILEDPTLPGKSGRLRMSKLFMQRLDMSPIWYMYPSSHHLFHLQGHEAAYPLWYRTKFSPSGAYLAIAKRRGLPEVVQSEPIGTWSITVWRQQDVTVRSKHIGLWEVLTEVTTHSADLRPHGSFAFHPTELLLAITGELETFLWKFGKDKPGIPKKICVHRASMNHLVFSHCGHYLFGDIDGQPIMTDVTKYLEQSASASKSTPTMSSEALRTQKWHLEGQHGALQFASQASIQPMNAVNVYAGDNGPELSITRKDSIGAIVRRRLDRTGETSQLLGFLPKSRRSGASATILNNLEVDDDEHVHLIIENDHHDSYRPNDPQNTRRPVYLERIRESVAKYTSQPKGMFHTIGNTSELSIMLRKRTERIS